MRLSLPGRELRGDEVGAVLYRHRVLPDAPAGMDEEAAPLVRSELQGALDGALLALDATWVNHPHANRLARHKLLQLRLARAEGLRVPETTVSADPEEIRARFRGWGGRMVAKLAGGQLPSAADGEAYAIYTTRVEAGDLADDAALAACPAMYQEEIGEGARAPRDGRRRRGARLPDRLAGGRGGARRLARGRPRRRPAQRGRARRGAGGAAAAR